MTSYHYRGPAIDHSLLSPSGRMSKRARKAAEAREHARLFDGVDFSRPELTNAEQAHSLRLAAANMRALAARGMKPRAYPREAAKLEAEADRLESQGV